MDDGLKAMTFSHPDYIPVGAPILPAAWAQHRDNLKALVLRHPLLYGAAPRIPPDYDQVWGARYEVGTTVDSWGCVWSNAWRGHEAYVTGHPLPTRADVRRLKAPAADDGFPHGFMYLRLADLRGFEELMLDFAEEPPELQMLIDVVLAYNLRQGDIALRKLAGKTAQTVFFADDLGMQTGLAMGAAKRRKYLKPCFARVYAPFRQAGHYLHMHTDGQIYEIIPDLVDCGVTMVNAQVRANGLDNLARVCKGKVAVNLDLDRQMFPFCTPEQIDSHIREAIEALGTPAGGLCLTAWIEDGLALENIEAICTALEKYRGYFR